MTEETMPSAADLDAQAEEQKAKEETGGEQKPILPICPHCGDEPFKPQAVPFNVENGVRLLIFYCETCHKVINCLILSMPQPRVMPAGPRIPRPQ